MPTPHQFIQDQLALLAWREGHAGSLNLMNAIMLAHANRVRTGVALEDGVYLVTAGDWMSNFREHSSLSPWDEFYEDELLRLWPDTRDPVFQAALYAAADVYNGAVDVLTDGAKFYAPVQDDFYNPGGWFHRNIASKPAEHPRTATISGWSFFA